MKLLDAAHLLSLSGSVTPEDIKKAHRRAAMKFHPDRNPAGLEMMKAINAAFDVLKDFTGDLSESGVTPEGGGYPDSLNDALNTIVEFDGISIEVCGAWVWVGGETYQHRKALKEASFRYASKKKLWYFRPDNWASSSRGRFSMTDIRETFGSESIAKKKKTQLAKASA